MKKSIVSTLHSQGLIKPPSFVISGMQYETIMGSEAYGVATDLSDKDIYGFFIPPKNYIFPHLDRKIIGFSTQIKSYDQFVEHHIKYNNTEYDLTIFNIVKYFKLLMENNPNVLDSIFTREQCCIFKTKTANMVRENRQVFLSKKLWHSFKGYAFSQLHKLTSKNPDKNSKRYLMYEKYGYDVKFAYHVIRLVNEAEQLLKTADMDIMQDNEILKSVRNGEWKLEEIKEWFYEREKRFQEYYDKSALPVKPNEEKITELLFSCLEEYYGSLENCIKEKDYYKEIVVKIKNLTDKVILG